MNSPDPLVRLGQQFSGLLTTERLIFYPALVAVCSLLAWIITVPVLGSGLLDASGSFIGNDFVAFYTSTRLWLNGQGTEMYDLAVQLEFQRALANNALDSFSPFMNPPHSVLLYAPFALGGYLEGLIGWWAFGLVCLITAVRLLIWAEPRLGNRAAWPIMGYFLVFFPVVAWFAYGQATMLVLLIWVGTYALLRTGKDLSAGLVLSLLAFKPQLAIPLVIPMLAGRRWGALTSGFIGLVGWVTVNQIFFPDEFHAWLRMAPILAEILRLEDYPSWGIHSWYGVSTQLIHPFSVSFADGFAVAASLLTLVALGSMWWGKQWLPGSETWRARMAITLAGGLLASFQLFTYDLTLLMIPFLLVASLQRQNSSERFLDGGPILGWSALVYLACFFSSYLTLAQQRALSWLGLPELGLQLTPFVLIGWCWTVYRTEASPAST